MNLTRAMQFAAACLKWTARVSLILAASVAALAALANHDRRVYVETHPCIVRARIAPARPVYFYVELWTPGSTAYECADVDELVWIFDPQPKR